MAALLALEGLAGAQTIEEVRQQYLPDRAYVGDVGVKVDLPAGWHLLKPGTAVKLPAGKMAAYHEPTGCLAVLAVDPLAPSLTLDDYLSRVIRSEARSRPTLTENGRESFRLGGREGELVFFTWMQSGVQLKAVDIICADDFYFYRLIGLSDEVHWAKALSAFKKLAGGFSITRSTDDRIAELARRAAEQCPYVTANGAAIAMREAVKRHVTAETSARFGFELTEKGRSGVPPEELAEFDRLLRTAILGLNPVGQAQLEAFGDDPDFIKNHSPEQLAEIRKLLTDAIGSLPPESRERLQAIGDKIWAAGVAMFDAPTH